MNNLVEITMHGQIGDYLGNKIYRANVSSVSEAIRSVETNSGHKLYKFLLENDKKGLKYRVLINKKDFISEEPIDINKPETIKKSELMMTHRNLKTIDIVPVLEGSDEDLMGIFTVIIGVILVIVGILVAVGTYGGGTPVATALIMAGIGLIAGGIISLLTTPPKFQDFREIDGATGRTSYLFNGPQNVTREGGPVPVGYGRLLVGSQVVSAAYVISNIDAAGKTINTTSYPGGGGGGGITLSANYLLN